ncbi:MAG: SMI1/KNR4 family protein [Pirellulales bacterium]
MTNEQLDQIEADVGFSLPAAYRRVALEFPFRGIRNDAVYWFFDDPRWVIEETLDHRQTHDLPDAHSGRQLLAIGHSAAGDLYLLDASAAGLPVLERSHETLAVELVWPTFEEFVEEWIRASDETEQCVDARYAAEQAAQWARMRRGLILTGFILLACLIAPIILGLLLVR